MRAAQKLPVAAAVAFYGTRLKQYLDSPLAAPFLAHCGTRDDHTPPDLMQEVVAYLPETRLYWYDAGHAFANDARPDSHSAEAAEAAHARTAAFLAEHVG